MIKHWINTCVIIIGFLMTLLVAVVAVAVIVDATVAVHDKVIVATLVSLWVTVYMSWITYN